MDKPLFIFAKINPKKEFYNDAKNEILSIVDKTLKEEGCFKFKLLSDDNNLYLYEEWKDEKALEIHYEMPYTKEVFKNYEAWLSKPAEVIKMKAV